MLEAAKIRTSGEVTSKEAKRTNKQLVQIIPDALLSLKMGESLRDGQQSTAAAAVSSVLLPKWPTRSLAAASTLENTRHLCWNSTSFNHKLIFMFWI